jgi:apolipoprotein N-acyltransferase
MGSSHKLLLPLASVAVSATLWWFGTGLHPLWWMTWLAPLPLLFAAPRIHRHLVFWLGFLAVGIGALNEWHYLRGNLQIPVPVCLVIVLLPSIAMGLSLKLWTSLVARAAHDMAVFALPVFWCAVTFLLSHASPHGTAGDLAYSQPDFLPVLQAASLAGVTGVTFLTLLLPSAVGVLLAPDGSTRFRAAGIGVLVVAVALGWGAWRSRSGHGGPTVIAGMAAYDPQGNLKAPGHLQAYGEPVRKLRASGAQIIVLPEKIAWVDSSNLDAANALAGPGSVTVVGVLHEAHGQRFNEARVFDSKGGYAGSYFKEHMVPGFESDLTPGVRRVTVDVAGVPCGMEICKDMDFPLLSRQYARDGIALLAAPAWDFGEDGWLHDRMAVVRGVESGVAVVRSAKEGLMTVSDSRGRILAEAHPGSAAPAFLTVRTPVTRYHTLYTTLGDWLGYVCCVVALVMVGLVLRHRTTGPNSV